VSTGNKDNISICTFRWNNWQGMWGPHYVNRLYRAIERNLTLPHRFVLFTDDTNGIDPKIEIGPWNPPSLMGWLPTLQAFSPDSGLTGRVWILDSDIIITGNIDHFFGFPQYKFINRRKVQTAKKRYMNSGEGVMFNAGWGHDLAWKPLTEQTGEVEQSTGGDDRPFYDQYVMPYVNIAYWDDLLPGQFVSFQLQLKPARKRKHWQQRIEKTRIISFHGRYKNHLRLAKGNGWIERYWY